MEVLHTLRGYKAACRVKFTVATYPRLEVLRTQFIYPDPREVTCLQVAFSVIISPNHFVNNPSKPIGCDMYRQV